MNAPSSISPEIDVAIEYEGWLTALPDAEDVCRQAAVAALGPRRERGLAILLTDDEQVRGLNARFRGRDAPTNVLSFAAADTALGHLGDIALALGVCRSEADAQAKPLADHLRHIVIHGVLHLLGYDHQDDDQAAIMEGLECQLLAGMGVVDPYAARSSDDVAKDTLHHG